MNARPPTWSADQRRLPDTGESVYLYNHPQYGTHRSARVFRTEQQPIKVAPGAAVAAVNTAVVERAYIRRFRIQNEGDQTVIPLNP
jgi:hypothetical protein